MPQSTLAGKPSGFNYARATSGFFALNVDGEDTVPIAHDTTAGTLKAALVGTGFDDAVVS